MSLPQMLHFLNPKKSVNDEVYYHFVLWTGLLFHRSETRKKFSVWNLCEFIIFKKTFIVSNKKELS